jgi:hypothetical protein
MDSVPPSFTLTKFYAMRWYLLAMEMSNYTVGEVQKFLDKRFDTYKATFGMKPSKNCMQILLL